MQPWFLAHGIDVNEPAFTRWLNDAQHTNVIHVKTGPYFPGGEWNREWNGFMVGEFSARGEFGYTRDEVIQKMHEMRDLDKFQVD